VNQIWNADKNVLTAAALDDRNEHPTSKLILPWKGRAAKHFEQPNEKKAAWHPSVDRRVAGEG
jgi:hypothetical protein